MLFIFNLHWIFFFFNPNTLITVLTKDPSQCQTFKHTQKQDAASITGVIVEHLEHIHSSLETKRKLIFFFLIPTFLKAFKCIFNFNLMLKMSQCFLIFIYLIFFVYVVTTNDKHKYILTWVIMTSWEKKHMRQKRSRNSSRRPALRNTLGNISVIDVIITSMPTNWRNEKKEQVCPF